MDAWWNALNILQRIYFIIGVAATLLLVLQIIMMLFGLGNGGDVDVDLSGDGTPDVTIDTSDGFSVFTLRGLIAFFAIGGWVGYTLADTSYALAIILSLVAGTAALILMALVVRGLMKMRSDGNITYDKAVGKFGEVYLAVPPKDKGNGKVNVMLEERFLELDAVQNGDKVIPTGTRVVVKGVQGDRLIVEKAD